MVLGVGEALSFIPGELSIFNESHQDLFTWHRQTRQGDITISSSEEERIHHHGHQLFFLPLSFDDSGNYSVRLIAGNGSTLQLEGVTKADGVMYTCRCTWEHNNKTYFSTASRKLQITGSPLEIKCEASVGINIKKGVTVWWEKNNKKVSEMEGYRDIENSGKLKEDSKMSFFSSTLIINKVKKDDLHPTSFRCCVTNNNHKKSFTLSLKPPDDWQHDVYVVYHFQQESKAIEDVLNKFLTRALPLVLEQRCGYRVFIQGRNDMPGEDRVEQVEERVRLSKTLMVVLTPRSEVNKMLDSSPSSPAGFDVDWQIALYQALVQELRVILVQLGEVGPQGYTHLSITLQHLVRKCAPLCWHEDSPDAAHWNSRFWKRVRYAMPIASAQPSSSFVV
ncbi:hypothetical protein CRUP_036291 [Coryphaenoides rupestris]|nr:hypothetical protein CRUP_036291 [Coryphaenoides rupestris]